MQSFIETQNIAHFKLLLKTETHPDKRKILQQLLAEENAKHIARVEAERAQNKCRSTPARAHKLDISDQKNPASRRKRVEIDPQDHRWSMDRMIDWIVGTE